MIYMKDCEHNNRIYICLFGKRFIFEDRKYAGWYRP